ncbi:hypothetical protein [Nocardioides yefusunii]|uniref:BON domain-containing protein n=1 Tax=Nocardioides yefusunii TaxID=2500546 RepID=A0ABW1R2B8_9ACTN|nr:hypothetical protein [Nocardioides yefusunii]
MFFDASSESALPHAGQPHTGQPFADPFDLTGDDARTRINRLLVENLVREGVQDLDAPHLVVCTDLEDGTVSFQGPYADALTAVLAAEAESGDIAPDISGLRFTVAPLLPPRPLD